MAGERGAVAAAVHISGKALLEVRLPPTGRASDSIAALKAETMTFMTEYMKAQHMSTEEVDLLEEVIESDGEGEGSGKAAKKQQQQHKGKKRKQQQSPKT